MDQHPTAQSPAWHPVPGDRMRWWNGSQWTDDYAPRPTGPEPTDETKRKWRPPFWLAAAAAVGALIFGASVGAGGASGRDVAATPEYKQLVAQYDVATDQNDDLTQEADRATEAAEKAEKSAERAQKAVEATADKEAELATLQATLDADMADVAAREAAVVVAEQRLAIPVPAPAPVTAPAPAPPSSAYYDNCTAARNAGAAPVRAGDPGYGRHLDRDGDGVGCE